MTIQDYIGKQFVGKYFHFTCDCLLSLDVTGQVVDYDVHGQEVLLSVSVNGKIIKIGTNHPNLQIEEL